MNCSPILLILIGDGNVGSIVRRRMDDHIDCTFYKSVGTAIMDVFSAHVSVQNAKLLNVGVKVDNM